ncbi:MAG: hypothetical protein V4458_13115 [Pseudomonadota bacterium]
MTHTVKKSVADHIGDFPGAVAKFAGELSAWSAHMKRVDADANNLAIKPIDKHAPFPRPTAHRDIDLAVNSDTFQPDYVVEDDGPTPEQRLELKKIELFNQVAAAEQAALNAVTPPMKRRFLKIRQAEIQKSDLDRAEQLKDKPNFKKAMRSARAKDENDFIDDHDRRQQRMDEIIRKAAKMQHDIDDLTIDNVDEWEMEQL